MGHKISSRGNILFFFPHNNIQLADRARLKGFLTKFFKMERKKLYSLCYIFCSDDYLLGINQNFLNHNYYTDIITFDLSENMVSISGEIYISTDRVRDNASFHGVSLKEELHRVIFHGALHLCGYKDKTKKDQELMRQMEDKCLSAYLK